MKNNSELTSAIQWCFSYVRTRCGTYKTRYEYFFECEACDSADILVSDRGWKCLQGVSKGGKDDDDTYGCVIQISGCVYMCTCLNHVIVAHIYMHMPMYHSVEMNTTYCGRPVYLT